MYALAACVVVFVLGQSLFFMIKAWRHGKEIGLSTETMKSTITSSTLFTIAPAISILATVLVLANALGIVLPWIRLSLVGNLAYETVAAQSVLEALGLSLSTEVTDATAFSTVAWVMTIGCCFGIILTFFFCKKLHKKLGDTINKSEKSSKTADVLSAAAFIGIIAAFIAREINGKSSDGSDDAGFMSIAVLITAIILMLVLTSLTKKFQWKKFEPFVMPISMFGAMGMAILLSVALPESITTWTWWG